MIADLEKMLKAWRRSLEQYTQQIQEARAKGTPCDQMTGAHGALSDAIRELEHVLAKNQPAPPRE